jgi:hypothetical protein
MNKPQPKRKTTKLTADRLRQIDGAQLAQVSAGDGSLVYLNRTRQKELLT